MPRPSGHDIDLSGNPGKSQSITLYTDGWQTDSGVGARIIIFKNQEALPQMKLRLVKKCTNNHAERIGHIIRKKPKKSRKDCSSNTLDSLKNMNNHNAIVD